MNIQTFTNPDAFVNRAQPFLEAQEAANSLVLGIALGIREKPDWLQQPPYEAVVEDEAGQPVLVAIQTPPQNILLSGADSLPQEALNLLVENLRSGGAQIPGVNAENRLALQFAENWSRASGQPYEVHMRERLYELREVIPPHNPPSGAFRQARLEDVGPVAAWYSAFVAESLHEEPPSNAEALAKRGIESGTIFLWEDGRPVSMAFITRPIPHGASISWVYTPPNLRGRGYASACVAALSQHILDTGKQFCTLFTDLDFPTSNTIYQKIGYHPVCDFLVCWFREPAFR